VSPDPSEESRRPDASGAAPRAARRSRSVLDEVFGDVLPDATRQELRDRETGESDAGDASGREDELRRDVPPHHG
jgi:hypothetical protein